MQAIDYSKEQAKLPIEILLSDGNEVDLVYVTRAELSAFFTMRLVAGALKGKFLVIYG